VLALTGGALLVVLSLFGALPAWAAGSGAAMGSVHGVTTSFVNELPRRAVLIAATAGPAPTDNDLDQVLDEMLSQAESVTWSLLGDPA